MSSAAAPAQHTTAPGEATRVVTLTPAPSVDRVYVVDGLQTGHVNRARHIEAGVAGNGINLARDLHAAGNVVVAVVPLDIETVLDFVREADPFRVVGVTHAPRVNTVVVCADGMTTNINQAAQPLSSLSWRMLHSSVAQEAARISAEWIVVGGSIPPGADGVGIDPSALRATADEHEARLCLDAPGAVLAEWMRAGSPPDLVSPNVHELEEAVGTAVRTVGDAVDGASRLIDGGVGAVLVSLGVNGALIVTPTRRLWARTPPTRVVNTTGAGDAALAGLMSGWRGEDDETLLRAALTRAVRWGRAAVGVVGSTIDAAEVPAARVDIEPPRRTVRVA